MKTLISFILFVGISMNSIAKELPNFDKLWNYENPQETETKFRALLPEAEKEGTKEYLLQLLTQIARTQSLQAKFEEAHKILDDVKPKLDKTTPVAELRYLLERGRTFNSAKKISEAIPLFLEAFKLGSKRKQDFYAIDAAHMMAIAEKNSDTQMEWNLKAVKLAESSKEPRAQGWLGSLYNNIAWTYHDSGKFQEALSMFQKALEFRKKKGEPGTIRIAKWSVARTLRSLGKFEDAFKIQVALEKEFMEIGERDGYVFEELAELHLIMGKAEEAKNYFGLAYDELIKDVWLKDNEPKRIARLKELGGR